MSPVELGVRVASGGTMGSRLTGSTCSEVLEDCQLCSV